MSGPSLWALSDELDALAAKIEASGGEITPEIEAEMDRLEGDFDAKVERCALFVREREAWAEAAKLEKERLAKIESAYNNAAARVRDLMAMVMLRREVKRVETPRARVTRVENPGSYRWTGDTFDAIPERFKNVRTVVTLDKTKVKEAVAAGEPLPAGVVLDKSYRVDIR